MKKVLVVLCMVMLMASCTKKAAETGGKQDIVFWDMAWGGDEYVTQMKALLEEMKGEIPELGEIEYVTLTWSNYYETIMTAIQSNTTPDIFTCGYGHAEMFARMGVVHYLDNLDKAYRAGDENLAKSFGEEIWNSRRYDNRMVQIPWMLAAQGFLYRRDMFEAVGATGQPKTWDEFMDVLRKIKAKYNIAPFSVDVAGGQSNHFVIMSLLNNGVGIVKKEGNKIVPSMSSPEAQNMYKYWIQLYEEGLVPEGMAGYVRADLQKLFIDGKAAVIYGDFAIDVYNSSLRDVTGCLDILRGPDTAKPLSLGFVNGLGIFSTAKEPELCEKAIVFLAKKAARFPVDGYWEAWPATNEGIQAMVETGRFFAPEAVKWIDTVTMPSYPIGGVYDGYGVIDGESILGNVAQMVFTGTSRDTAAIGAYGDSIIQDAIDSQTN
jgi:multiple sugar transport system substrate-binding protein